MVDISTIWVEADDPNESTIRVAANFLKLVVSHWAIQVRSIVPIYTIKIILIQIL